MYGDWCGLVCLLESGTGFTGFGSGAGQRYV